MFKIIELIANGIDLGMLFYATDKFSVRKEKFNGKAISILFLAQAFFMRYTNTAFGNASMASAAINIALFIFIMRFFYKINLRKITGAYAILFLMMLISEGIVSASMGVVLNAGMEKLLQYDTIYRAAAILISKVITVILIVIIFNFVSKEKIVTIKYFSIISVMLIVNILLHLFMLEFYTGNMEKYVDIHLAVLIFFILINVINALSFFLIVKMIKYIEKEIRWKMTEKEYEKQIKYLKSYRSITVEIKKLKHDLSKHMIIINSYLDSGQTEEARNYMNEVLNSYKNINEVASIHNKIISSIINYNLRSINENNILFRFYVDVPKKIHIKDIDLTIAMSNIMDNAIEACSKIPEKSQREIELYIEYKNGILFIKETNTFAGILHTGENKILTDKQDTQNHGFGLENIKSSVARYGGCFELYTKENKFFVEIKM